MDPIDFVFITRFESQYKTVRECIDGMTKLHDRLLVKIEMLRLMPHAVFSDATMDQMNLTFIDTVKVVISSGRSNINAWTLHSDSHKDFFGEVIYTRRIRETVIDFEKAASSLLKVVAEFETLNNDKKMRRAQQANEAEQNNNEQEN